MTTILTKRITDIRVLEQTCVGFIHWDDLEMDTGPMPIGVGNTGTFCTEVDGERISLWSKEILVENFNRLQYRHPGTWATIIQGPDGRWELVLVKDNLDPRWFNFVGYRHTPVTPQNNP